MIFTIADKAPYAGVKTGFALFPVRIKNDDVLWLEPYYYLTRDHGLAVLIFRDAKRKYHGKEDFYNQNFVGKAYDNLNWY